MFKANRIETADGSRFSTLVLNDPEYSIHIFKHNAIKITAEFEDGEETQFFIRIENNTDTKTIVGNVDYAIYPSIVKKHLSQFLFSPNEQKFTISANPQNTYNTLYEVLVAMLG